MIYLLYKTGTTLYRVSYSDYRPAEYFSCGGWHKSINAKESVMQFSKLIAKNVRFK